MQAGSYNSLLVLFSLLVAMLASYTALDMAGRIATAQGRAAHWWLAGGACARSPSAWWSMPRRWMRSTHWLWWK